MVRLWQRLGHVALTLVGGSEASRRAAQLVLGPIESRPHDRACVGATLAIIAVPDDRLDSVVAECSAAPHGGDPAPLVVHLCGSRGRNALDPLRVRGCHTAALHPMRSFPARDPGLTDLAGAACAIECDAADRDRLFRLVRSVGGAPFELGAEHRDLYHAGAALAGNGILAVIDAAERALLGAGVPSSVARGALVALAQGALGNAARDGAASALTGPVVRGDEAVVRRHVEAFARLSLDDVRLYSVVSEALARLAATRPDGDRSAAVAAYLREHLR